MGFWPSRGSWVDSRPVRIVSYYTLDTPYAVEVQRLRSSLDDLGIEPYELVPTPDTGSWLGNCAQKPMVLTHQLARAEPVLFVDADAELLSDPRAAIGALMADHDLGVHYFDGVQVASGTIALNPTAGTKDLLSAWCEICTDRPDLPDQDCLAMAIDRVGSCRVRRLPPEYCYIFDLSARLHPDVEPVIRHHQASRRFRV